MTTMTPTRRAWILVTLHFLMLLWQFQVLGQLIRVSDEDAAARAAVLTLAALERLGCRQ